MGVRRLLMILLGSIVPAPSVVAGATLVGNNVAAGTIYDINVATRAATNPRETGIFSLVGVASSGDGTQLFGLTTFAGTPNPNALFRINPATGTPTLVGPTGRSNIFEGDLAFQPGTGLLFGLEDVPEGGRNLLRIDTTTGQATSVGTVNFTGDLSAMTFSPNGTLYVIDNELDLLLTVNPTTAAVTSSIRISRDFGFTVGMAFDPATGVLYAADGGTGGTGNLYTLNPQTGLLTLVGPTGVTGGLGGLTFTPEPSSMAALGIGGLALVTRRRSRRRLLRVGSRPG